MDNINNAQTNTKGILRTFMMIFAITLVLTITMSNVFAVPAERPESCLFDETAGEDLWECCWTETDPSDPEQIEIYKCQHCWIESGVVDCTPVKPGHSGPPTTKDDISPGDTEGIEQPPSQNTPPIKSDNSVAPNDDSNIIDEQQSNPNPPLTDQRAPDGNVGVLEELEDSSNSKSEDSVSSDNQGLFNVVPQNP